MSNDELKVCDADDWHELMPGIRELAWQKRSDGELEILQKGEVLSDDVDLDDVPGPIRLRRKKSSKMSANDRHT